MKINGHTFIELGFKGREIAECINEANLFIAKNIEATENEIISHIQQVVKKAPPKLERGNTISFNKAIIAKNEREEKNVAMCEKGLSELTTIPVVKNAAIMPDACVAGTGDASICVGGAIAVENAIIPAAHSADICCSMYLTFFKSDKPIKKLLELLKTCTRFGPGGRDVNDWVPHAVNDEDVWDNPYLKDLKGFAKKHMADQGDGNHFAYIGETIINQELIDTLTSDTKKEVLSEFLGEKLKCLVTHHGSRGLGAKLYKRGLRDAIKYTNSIAKNIPKNAAWLSYETQQGKDYWNALQYIARWTKANHSSIHTLFHSKINNSPAELAFTSIHNQHNFVWKRGDMFYHGKGATPAWDNQVGIIPLNMGAPILIVKGNNNKDYLEFAPHGAGRNLSRTALKKELGVDTPEKEKEATEKYTKGIEVIWYMGLPDVSESPVAYKDANTIKNEIKEFDLATIVNEIKPLGCIMAGESPYIPAWKLKKKNK